MATTDPQSAEPKTNNWRFRFSKRKLLILALSFVVSGIGFTLWRSGLLFVSWTRYTQIRRAIEADPQHLLDEPFDEVSKELSLEDVPWDECTLQGMPGCENRMYHFPGFYLHVTVELLPSGATPSTRNQWYSSHGGHFTPPGAWWLAHQYPFVRIDGISDPKERIERFFREANEEAQRDSHRLAR